MLIEVFSILTLVALFFTVMAYWRMGIIDYFMAGLIWLIAAVSATGIEVAYALDIGGTLTTGAQVFTQSTATLAIIFFAISGILFAQALILQFKPQKWGDERHG